MRPESKRRLPLNFTVASATLRPFHMSRSAVTQGLDASTHRAGWCGMPHAWIALGILIWLGLCQNPEASAAEPPFRWTTHPTHRFTPLAVQPTGNPGFTSLPTAQTGIAFTNYLSDATVSTNRLTEIGSGVALGDVDGDGWVDIYLCRISGGNALYRNLGQWRFEEITQTSGTGCPNQFSTGSALADMDGDGDLDLLVNSLGGGTRLFLNDGRAHFTEKTDSGLAREFGATSLALADVDGDGDLDLYVTNYRSDTFQDHPPGLNITTRKLPDGSTVIEPRDRMLGLSLPTGGLTGVERGQLDVLYINRGNGRFGAAPWDVGIFLDEKGEALTEPPTDWGLSALFRDIDGDGFPDLYVCNDFVNWPDRIWWNTGGKRFTAAPRHAFRNTSLSSMSADMADINRDGFMDLFAADMLSPHHSHRAWQRPDTLEGAVIWPTEDPSFRPEITRNTLHLARGDGTFAEIAPLAGLAASDWTWSAAFLDVDLDGWEDLLMTTGSNHELQDFDAHLSKGRNAAARTPAERLENLRQTPRRETPSMAFRNRRDLSFEDASRTWGFDTRGVAHGMAFGDLDNDGDLDVVINTMNAPARVLRNEAAAPRVAVRLKAAGANTRGVSAKVEITGGPVTQSQEMIAGGRYLSSDDPMRVFAAGSAKSLAIQVSWRSGRTTRIEGVLPNHMYEIHEDATVPAPPRTTNAPIAGWFEDQSASLNHRHVDRAFDDFERDPLMPHKLSKLGPGLSIADFDGDGREDLAVGGGTDGRTLVYRNRGSGTWAEWDASALPKNNRRDDTSLLAVPRTNGGMQLLIGESAWEEPTTNAAAFRVYAFPAQKPGQPPLAPAPMASGFTGPMGAADVDGDGVLDVFIGARAIPGNFPEPATSLLLRQTNGLFALAQSFPNLGFVSGATFADLDGDGDPDLLLACHWGSPRFLRNDRGRLIDVTRELGLAELTGLWNGVAVGDFDGDGRLDFIASNWGSNWRTDQSIGSQEPVYLFHGDFSGSGSPSTLLASLDPELGAIAPWRERRVVSRVIPTLPDRFPTYKAYATSSVATVLGPLFASAKSLVASEFRSTLFLNRTNHFAARPLPVEAQFAPAFGIAVADFDGNGTEDVFLAQNFFGVDRETARQDAGTGLLLFGDGTGGFKSMGPLHSGIWIPGEQRAVATGDFDDDGRPDLVVTQNSESTRMYRNRRANPGLRITVRDSDHNPTGIGTTLRLKSKAGWGPARAIHAGNGYWTQSSPTQILSGSNPATAIEIHWPGGKRQEFEIPEGVKSLRITRDGIGLK